MPFHMTTIDGYQIPEIEGGDYDLRFSIIELKSGEFVLIVYQDYPVDSTEADNPGTSYDTPMEAENKMMFRFKYEDSLNKFIDALQNLKSISFNHSK